MAIALPATPRTSSGTPVLRRFGADLRPLTGGPVQRFTRIGTRFAVQMTYPPMTKAQAEPLIAALVDADTLNDTVIAPLTMAPLVASLGAAPLVNGAGQAGAILNADAFTPGVVIPVGTPFSFLVAGRNYLHMTRAAISANGSGAAALPIGPLLRASPADNTALNFAAPQIEGFVEGPEIPWSVDTAMLYGVSFALFEIE